MRSGPSSHPAGQPQPLGSYWSPGPPAQSTYVRATVYLPHGLWETADTLGTTGVQYLYEGGRFQCAGPTSRAQATMSGN